VVEVFADQQPELFFAPQPVAVVDRRKRLTGQVEQHGALTFPEPEDCLSGAKTPGRQLIVEKNSANLPQAKGAFCCQSDSDVKPSIARWSDGVLAGSFCSVAGFVVMACVGHAVIMVSPWSWP